MRCLNVAHELPAAHGLHGTRSPRKLIGLCVVADPGCAPLVAARVSRSLVPWSEPALQNATGETKLTRAHWTITQFFFGSFSGHMFFMMLFAVVLVVGFGLIWSFTIKQRYGESIWKAYTLFIDPGTQTGEELLPGRYGRVACAAAFSMTGFIYILVLTGIVVDFARGARRHTRARSGRTETVRATVR